MVGDVAALVAQGEHEGPEGVGRAVFAVVVEFAHPFVSGGEGGLDVSLEGGGLAGVCEHGWSFADDFQRGVAAAGTERRVYVFDEAVGAGDDHRERGLLDKLREMGEVRVCLFDPGVISGGAGGVVGGWSVSVQVPGRSMEEGDRECGCENNGGTECREKGHRDGPDFRLKSGVGHNGEEFPSSGAREPMFRGQGGDDKGVSGLFEGALVQAADGTPVGGKFGGGR